MERKLKTLLKDIPSIQVKGSQEKVIFGLCNDSRKAAPQEIFFARKGEKYDGYAFIDTVRQNGVSVIVSSLYNPLLEGVTQIITSDIADLETTLAARFYQNPSHKLDLIGITGTNGKTTTAYLLHGLLSKKETCGLMGTVESILGDYRIPSTFTTADIITNQKMLAHMVKMGGKSVVMEVTSHGLRQNRVEGLQFSLAIFTNLTEEHLDYHKTMEEYGKCKLRLFDKLSMQGKALVNAEDPFSETIREKRQGLCYSYGLQEGADYRAKEVAFLPTSMHFTLVCKGESIKMQAPLVGEFNLYNVLAAVAAAHLQGMTFPDIAQALPKIQPPPGRMELVPNNKGISIVIDFAHTPDALQKTLHSLSSIKKNRILLVFGCGGNRDPYKRPKMGKIAEDMADIIFITNDNPRLEDPIKIAEDIEKGLEKNKPCYRILDRKKAIETALNVAREGDIVCIAGKGHEMVQIIGSQRLPFQEKEIVQEILQKL